MTNANECPNLPSYDATFRMHVFEPEYPKNMLVPGSNVPHFNKMSSSKNESQNNTGKPNNSLLSRPSNVYQILNQLQNEQQANFKSEIPVQSSCFKTTTPFKSETQCTEEQMHLMGKEISATPKDVTPPLGEHVRLTPRQPLQPGESVALSNVVGPLNGWPAVTRIPLTKQEVLSQYSSCFNGIGHFPGEPYKFPIKAEHITARHAPRKVAVHLEESFKQEIYSLVE